MAGSRGPAGVGSHSHTRVKNQELTLFQFSPGWKSIAINVLYTCRFVVVFGRYLPQLPGGFQHPPQSREHFIPVTDHAAIGARAWNDEKYQLI